MQIINHRKYYLKEKDLQQALGSIFKTLDTDTKLEYKTQYGRIDIDTSKLLVEIKEINAYKEGIGQLFSYGSICPNKKRLLILFSRNCEFIPKEKITKIYKLCRENKLLCFVVCKENLYTSFYDFLKKYIYKDKI